MTDKRLLGGGDGDPDGDGSDGRLSPDQRAVFDAYYDEDGVICTPAGSGTGKTTTAIEVVAEAVVRELERRPGQNPFESILVTTFTNDAARQLKTELKERLREHRRAAPDHDPVVAHWEKLLRWIETASHVRTIDSFTQDLLREIALEAGVAPAFGVADGIRRSDLLEEVFGTLREDPDLADPIARLESAFPPDEDGDDWEELVVELHRRCREFCTPIGDARRQLLRSVTAIHAGREPEAFEDVLAIAGELTDFDSTFVREGLDDHDAWVEHARDTYRASRRLAGDFGVVLEAFDERYDELSRTRGTLTHTDITYIVREYLEGDRDDPRRDRVRESLASRFEHVVVDEFQDTNYAQCRILSHLLPGANALLIGDLKQSIYEWRSAEPRLFADLVADAHGRGDGNVLDADRVVPVPLAENFRSHPHLVATANHVFPRIFADPGRGGIGTFDVEYDHLSAERAETEPDDAHVHVLRLTDVEKGDDQSRREALVEAEAERVAGTLRTVLDEGTLSVDRDLETIVGDGGDGSGPGGADSEGVGPTGSDHEAALEPVRPGDVAILFRSKTYMRHYSRVLDRYGIENAIIGTHSLYREPEIEALIDALAWIGDPGPRTLESVVDSGVAALSPAARDRLAAAGYDLDAAIATDGDGDGGDPDDHVEDEGGADAAGDDPARSDLRRLAELRDDLRRERPRSKGRIVSALLAHSALDVVALADREGLQRYANVRRFVEVIDDWEDDETLVYGEFMRRLQRLRDGRVEDDQTIAAVADMDSPEAVKLLTAHTAKGLEFPVVVLADTARNEAYQKACDEPFVADRRHGIALRPTTGDGEQPDAGTIPNFEGRWFHDGDSEYDFDRGLLWLSERRGTDGRIRHDHPLSDYVRDRRAEFWRLLYVAVTRAGDHLIVPVGETRGTMAKYNTWAAALSEHLDPGEDGVLETDDGPVPVGVDELAVADPPTGTTVDLDDLLSEAGAADARSPARQFAPTTLAVTDVADLLDDPAGYQWSVLQGRATGTVDAGEPSDAGGTGAVGRVLDLDLIAVDGGRAPTGVDPVEWGDAVHAAIEAIHRGEPATVDDSVPVEAVENAVGRALGPAAPVAAVREELFESVLPAYRATGTRDRVADATDRFPEFRAFAPLSGAGPGGDRPTYVRGRIDLLYRDAAGWRIADFKTGTVPGEDDRRLDAYCTQLSAYAWLLWAVYGIDVAGADLVYLHPDPAEVSVAVDPSGFGETLAGAVTDLVVDDEGILRRYD